METDWSVKIINATIPIHIMRILHLQFSFNINLYETSLGNVINLAFGKLYNVSGKSFIKVFIEMTWSKRFF